MPVIVISEAIFGGEIDRLAGEFETLRQEDLWRRPEDLAIALAGAQALLVRNQTLVTAELIERCPKLRIIARAGVGLDNVDIDAATRAGIVVTYAPRENSTTAAELAIGLLLALARQIPAADRDTRLGGWKRQVFTGTEVAGKTLGIVGFGRIGQRVASRARALEMDVVAHDPLLPVDAPVYREVGVSPSSLEELLSISDFVSLHVPLTPETRNMMDAPRFALMKPGARFINTSRGEVVDESPLWAALQSGRLAAAALDVRTTEPPTLGAFEKMDNVILTPHIAGFTQEAQARVVQVVCRDVASILRGGEALNYFNFPRPRS